MDLDTVEAKEHGVNSGTTGDTGDNRGRGARWKRVGIALLVLVAIGAVYLMVAFDPTKLDVNTLDPTLSRTRHGAAGFAVALGVFLIALITIVPYFALSRLRYRPAASEAAEPDPAGR